MVQKEDIELISSVLRKYLSPEIYSAFIFGSRATGQCSKFSDFDIGILGPRLSAETYFEIVGDLEDSSFPYLVDVVQMCDVSKEFLDGALEKKIPIDLRSDDTSA